MHSAKFQNLFCASSPYMVDLQPKLARTNHEPIRNHVVHCSDVRARPKRGLQLSCDGVPGDPSFVCGSSYEVG